MATVISFIGETVGHLFGGVVHYFKGASTGQELAGLLILAGIIAVILQFVFLFQYRSVISQASKSVTRHGESPEAFARNFESVKKDFRNLREKRGGYKLSEAFGEYVESLVFLNFDNVRETTPVIQNTSRPQDWFDTEGLGMHMPVFLSLSNIFVGVGLLLTFIGLIAALDAAVVSLQSNEIEQGLKDLLQAASTKFWASAAALGVSIILRVTTRIAGSIVDEAVGRLSSSLEDKVQFVTAEQLQTKQIELLEEQNKQLQTFNTDLAMKLGERIETAVGKVMTPVAEGLEKMSSSLGQTNIEAMREISATVVNQVQGAAGDTLAKLADRLDGLDQTLSAFSSTLSTSTHQFEGDINETLGRLNEGVGELHASLSKSTQETNESMLATLGTVLSNVRDASKEAEKSVTEQITNAGSEASGQISDVISNIGGDLSTSFNGLIAVVNNLSARIRETHSEAGRLTSAIGETTDRLGQAATSVGGSVSSLADGAASIQSAITPLTSAAESIQSAVSAVEGSFGESIDQIQESLSVLSSNFEQLEKIWQEHADQFKDVDNRLGGVFSHLSSQLEQGLSHMSEFVSTTDNAFANAVAMLNGSIEELGEAVSELDEKLSSRR
jgi:ABC-type transporter Mla subunit MlaD